MSSIEADSRSIFMVVRNEIEVSLLRQLFSKLCVHPQFGAACSIGGGFGYWLPTYISMGRCSSVRLRCRLN
jgi:hypothetical protein